MKSSAAGTAVRWLAPFLAVAAVVATALSPVQAPQIQLASEANPLVGKPFYVDPISKAMRNTVCRGSRTGWGLNIRCSFYGHP